MMMGHAQRARAAAALADWAAGPDDFHDSCTSNLHAALKEQGFKLTDTPLDYYTPSPFNLWMNVPLRTTAASSFADWWCAAQMEPHASESASVRSSLHCPDAPELLTDPPLNASGSAHAAASARAADSAARRPSEPAATCARQTRRAREMHARCFRDEAPTIEERAAPAGWGRTRGRRRVTTWCSGRR